MRVVPDIVIDAINEALNKAIEACEEGWAVTLDERANMHQALLDYYIEHGELPDGFKVVRRTTLEGPGQDDPAP